MGARVGTAQRYQVVGGLRKRPLQERSKATIQTILDTARDLVEEVGYEAVVGSPTMLLDKSGVSRGSFYAFFESPARVLDELSYQVILEWTVALDDVLRSRRGTHWMEIIDVLIDFYTEKHRIPLVRELWVRQNLTHRVRELDHTAINEIAATLLVQFREHAPLLDSLTELQCRVAVHALERLFQFAFADDPNGDPAIIAEAKRMLTDYFAGYADQ